MTSAVCVDGGAAVNVGVVTAVVCVVVVGVVSECVGVVVAVVVGGGGGGGDFVIDELCRPRKTAPPMMITAGIRSVHTGNPRFAGGGGCTTCCWPCGHGNATGAGG